MKISDIPDLKWAHPFFVIGVTGSPGSGKSTVSRIFEKLGAHVINADEEAKRILHSEEMRSRITDLFGVEILNGNGVISNEKLARIVFSDYKKRTLLNQILHPEVRKRFYEAKSQLKEGDVLLYDIPLLFETDCEDDFDLIITVTAQIEARMERVKNRNGWTREEYLKREEAQFSSEKKASMADIVIENDDGLEELESKVNEIYKKITDK